MRRFVLVLVVVALSLTFLRDANAEAEQTAEVISLNNEGVKDLNQGKLVEAIGKFESALKISPYYRLARMNLAIVQNNTGLGLKSKPKEALIHFHKAFLLNPDYSVIVENINACVILDGHDPTRFEERVKIADDDASAGDYTGAAAEYSLALSLRKDDDVQKELGEAFQHVEPFYRKYELESDTAVDYRGALIRKRPFNSSYMSDVELDIKRKWRPIAGKISSRAVVQFQIDEFGHVSQLSLIHKSDRPEFDKQAMEAVGNFNPLPAEAGKRLLVETSFDFNALTSDYTVTSNGSALGN